MARDDRKLFRYAFKVLGKYEARLADNEPHVTLSVLAGRNESLVFCGTLTMSEAEWATLRTHLGLGAEEELELNAH